MSLREKISHVEPITLKGIIKGIETATRAADAFHPDLGMMRAMAIPSGI